MSEIMDQYKSLYIRLDKSEKWLELSKYKDWEQVNKEENDVYILRQNIMKQIELIQKTLKKG